MRKTRFISWVFIVLGLVFFALPDFRHALEVPLAGLYLSQPEQYPRLAQFYTLRRFVSNEQLLQLARDAENRNDAAFMAFAALNLPVVEAWNDIARLADRAVAVDHSLTWVYIPLLYRYQGEWDWDAATGQSQQYVQFMQERIRALEGFDPENAVPHLMRAELIRAAHGPNWPPGSPLDSGHLDALAADTQWRSEMEKAFGSQRYDSFGAEQFELARTVLGERGWDHPAVVEHVLSHRAYINFLNARDYTNLLLFKVGAESENRGRFQEAIRNYWTAAEFGSRMEIQSSDQVDRLMGVALERLAYGRLIPALEKARMMPEAARVRLSDERLVQELLRSQSPLAATTGPEWSLLLINLLAGLVIVFLFASFGAILYANFRQWIQRKGNGDSYSILSTAQNYLPPLFFLSSAALYLAFVPYSENFTQFMTVKRNIHWISPELFQNIYPIPDAYGIYNRLPVENPFGAYVLYALAGLAALFLAGTVVEIVRRRRRPGWR